MPYMNKVYYRDVTNSRISGRLKQVLVLALTVIVGMLISVSFYA